MKIESIFYLTKFCNFKCTYCYKGDQINEKVLSKKRLKIALDDFKKVNIETFYLRIRGGEFSLKEETYELINELVIFLKELQNSGTKVFLEYSTNLAGSKDFFSRLTIMLKNSGITISTDFSLHAEYYQKNKLKNIISKINLIYSILPNANYRLVFDNFDHSLPGNKQEELIKNFENISNDIKFKFSNTYGLFLDDNYIDNRIDYDIHMVIDEELLPLIDNKRIPFKKYLKHLRF